MGRKLNILFVAIALLAAACTPLSEQVEVTGCDIESLESVSLASGQISLGTTLSLDGRNDSCRDLSLVKLYAEVFSRSGKRVAIVSFEAEKGEKRPTLHRHSTETVEIPLLVSFDNPLSALSFAAMTIEEYGEKGYTLSYDCTLKAGCLKKRFTEDKVPVEYLAKQFDR